MARLVDVYARRAQIQERLTNQVADDLWRILEPRGVGVIIQGKHHCMVSRGASKQQSSMVTMSLKGLFQEHKVKDEFLQHTK